MQWDASAGGGFTTGKPWLPLVDPQEHNVEAQRKDPGSFLSLVRDLLALRRVLGEGFELVEAGEGVVAYRRGDHTVAVNTTAEALAVPLDGESRLETQPGALRDRRLGPHAGVVVAT
jgi:alpha-glucosidase